MKRHRPIIVLVLLLLHFLSAQAQGPYSRITNLPSVYVSTFDGYGITSKTTYKYCKLIYVDEQDQVTHYDSVEIRGRGNSTWNMSKKPYRIKLHQKERFLGEGKANTKKWTLLANAGDKTLIRNAVTSAMGEFLGMYFNPAYKFVDLNVNGSYYGNYQISDQVDVRKYRVHVKEQDYPLTDESNITGGYLLEADGFKDGNCFTTSTYSVPIRIHYPDEDEIAYEQNEYIRQYMRDFERVLRSDDFTDPEHGYRRWVDSTSLANWYIATEVSANIDGFYSTYFYKDRDDSLLYWGPLWDYDIAYGNDTRKGDTSRRMMTDVGYGQVALWINRMWDDPWFSKLINRRFHEALDAGLEEHLMHTIDSLVTLLDRSQARNYQKWGINNKMYHERVLYSSYDQYVRDLKSFITVHIDYLEEAFADKQPLEPTPPFKPGNFYYRLINAANAKAIDVYGQYEEPGSRICLWDNLADRLSEQWEILPVDDHYFMLINRFNQLALNDPTEGTATATTNTGARLNVEEPDEENPRQHWYFTPQGTAGYYNLTNRYTDHTANLSGGSSSNGTSIISYTTDDRNTSSTNRLWYIIADEEIKEPYVNGIDDMSIEPEEYALAYDPQTQTLHFGSATPDQLTFMASVYSLSGTKVVLFRADERCSISHLPSSTYIISWTVGGKTRSAKVKK